MHGPGPSPFELATARRQDARRRAYGSAPQGDGLEIYFSAALAASHNASISASVDCAGVLPRAASAPSIEAKRRSNFWLVARSVASGSASRWRARFATANNRSPTSAAAAARLPFLR